MAALITAITAVILAVIGLIQVREMRQTRKAEYRPHLRVFLNLGEKTIVFLRFVNIGRIAACDLDFQIVFKKDGETIQESSYKEDTMLPQGDRYLITPELSFEALLGKFTTATVSGTYTDGFGKEYTLNKSIDVKAFIDSVKSARMLWRSRDKVV